MLKFSATVIIQLICAKNILARPGPYTHSAWLDANGRSLLEWRVDRQARNITLRHTTRAKGWAAFGLAPKASMAGADIILTFRDLDGKGQVLDMWAPANGYPQLDVEQNVELLSYAHNGTHSVAELRRPLRTCDDHDWTINEDTVRVLWALSDQPPTFNDARMPPRFAMHAASERGARSVHFLYKQNGQSAKEKLERDPEVKIYDFNVKDAPVPSSHHTAYWCQVFKVPPQHKHSLLVGFDAIIQPASNARFVHHMILYGCDAAMANYTGPQSGLCYPQAGHSDDDVAFKQYNGSWLNPMTHCRGSAVAGWAYGGETFAFPADTGIQIFDQDQTTVFMLEMHYDNQDYEKDVLDNSGLRAYLTPEGRPVKSVQLSLGLAPTAQTTVIPPGQPDFTQYAYCPRECTNALGDNTLLAYAGLLHTHLIGVRVRLRHVRDGVELPPLLQDMHYDFNYQNYMMLPKAVEIRKNDELILECVYDSSAKVNTTLGGLATSDEMCFAFMYAKTTQSKQRPPIGCYSGPDLASFTERYNVTASEAQTLTVEEDASMNTTYDANTFYNTRVDWTAVEHGVTAAERLQKVLRHADYGVYCTFADDGEAQQFTLTGPPDIEQIYTPPATQCTGK